MRIIAGNYRSRVIKTLEGEQTRPTQDRIKEAMFSSIGNVFVEEEVLDLFGGSGSVALECLSRGASFACVGDQNPKAIAVIEENARNLEVRSQMHILQMDYLQALEKWKDKQFSFIFLDPPYALHVLEDCLRFIEEQDMLVPYGVIVVESDLHQPLQERYNTLYKSKEKKYGITLLRYYKKGEAYE